MLVSGEQAADAELTGLSTVAAGIAVQAHIYLAHGGVDNLRQLHAFLSDTVLLTGFGFSPPVVTPTWGELERPASAADRPDDRGAVLPRAAAGRQHRLRRGAVPTRSRTPAARPLPIFCASLRTAEPDLLQRLGDADAMVVTVLAAGGTQAGDGGGRWRRRQLERRTPGGPGHPDPAGAVPDQLAQPVERQRRRAQPAGRRHPGRGARVRRPHHHRAVLVQGDRRRRADRLRRRPGALRAGRRASRSGTPGCGTSPPADKRVALVLSAYPTKHARIGNAVGLDTPASAVALLRAMRERGYDGRATLPGGREPTRRRRADPRPDRRGGQDPDWLTDGQLAGNPIRMSAATTATGSPRCPPS